MRCAFAALLLTAHLLTGCDRAAAPERPGEAKSGARVYAESCVGCHGGRGEGIAGAGPALTGLGQRPETELRQVVRNGRPPMPSFPNLTEAELSALIGHLRQLAGGAATPGPSNR